MLSVRAQEAWGRLSVGIKSATIFGKKELRRLVVGRGEIHEHEYLPLFLLGKRRKPEHKAKGDTERGVKKASGGMGCIESVCAFIAKLGSSEGWRMDSQWSARPAGWEPIGMGQLRHPVGNSRAAEA